MFDHNPTSPPPLIHIGYPKTGSTTLQNQFFSLLDGYKVLGQPVSRENSAVQQVIHHITDAETMEYCVDRIQQEVIKYCSNANLIVSEEAFATGSSLGGLVDRAEIAKRLIGLWPRAKILVVLREQASMVRSWYLQYKKINRGNVEGFDDWLRALVRNQQKGMSGLLSSLQYHKLVSLYQDLYGKENVKVMLFEQMPELGAEYFLSISDFMGLSRSDALIRVAEGASNQRDNSTITSAQTKVFKVGAMLGPLRNIVGDRFKKMVLEAAAKGRKETVTIDEEQLNLLRSIYTESNAKLAALVDAPLEKYGYMG